MSFAFFLPCIHRGIGTFERSFQLVVSGKHGRPRGEPDVERGSGHFESGIFRARFERTRFEFGLRGVDI